MIERITIYNNTYHTPDPFFQLFLHNVTNNNTTTNVTGNNLTTNATTLSNLEECNFSNDIWEPSVSKTTFLSILVAIVAILTTGGNLLVMISFKIEPQLRTISNCFLLSLAVADITIGVFSIPLYSMYLLLGNVWPLGLFVCDIWLSLDYTMSNASVANLLLISFDRYFSVTRPLTYRVHRTPVKAGIMIALAWIISILLWTPWIMIWPRVVEEKRTNECYIAFMDNKSTGGIILTVVTAIGAFFIPVFVMCVLYFKIYKETEKRKKNFPGLRCAAEKQKSNNQLLATSHHDSKSEKSTKHNSNCKNNLISINDENCKFQSNVKPTISNDNEKQQKLSAPTSNGSLTSLIASEHDKAKTSAERNYSQGSEKSLRINASKTSNQSSTQRKKRPGQDQKAAKTLCAILLAFIITWTPYNIFVLIQTFSHCAIHPTLYAFGYWLCYLNSTINPLCYALCNELFRTSFVRILKCQWKKRHKYFSPSLISASKSTH